MSATANVRGPCPPPNPGAAYWLAHRICTSNPFYVISAGLFLFGLRISFAPQVRDIEVGALMSGLAGYTLLLAVTTLVLVRFGNVWDDVRTVLLLVVLMFLATSVTFDELLVAQPHIGFVCMIGGFAFAVAISEFVLRGIRLQLSGLFRAPYYLILGLFFLYPLALSPLLSQPKSEMLQWGLYGFSTVAGLAFLTLLPAIWRGPTYVANNGSPWSWPLYPWVVFGVLALAAPARAFLLCFSMHWLDLAQGTRTIFGGYFLAPFGLCLAVLLLELGRVSGNRLATTIAMLLPFAFIFATSIDRPHDPIYQGFLQVFRDRLGVGPFYLTLLGTTAFYAFAAARGIDGALGATTGMLASLACVGPNSLLPGRPLELYSWPIALAAALQIGVGLRRRTAWNWIFGAFASFVFVLMSERAVTDDGTFRFVIAVHAAIVVLALGGAWCSDEAGRRLRMIAVGLVSLIVATTLCGIVRLPARLPEWVVDAYPIVVATALACYATLLADRTIGAFVAAIVAAWLVRTGWQSYVFLRSLSVGLDFVVLSMSAFAVAIGVSLAKSGRLARWLADRGWTGPAIAGAEPMRPPVLDDESPSADKADPSA